MRAPRSNAPKSHARTRAAKAVPSAPAHTTPPAIKSPALLDAVPASLRYAVDLAQRSAMALQVLVDRGDMLAADEREGLPMRLAFQYETVLDARDFPEPAGYSLLRVLPGDDPCFVHCEGAAARPVIFFDPRAGHGPGIGGSKRDSELGMALHRGHPTYFVAHHMQPCAGQTLARVHHALRRFVAAVSRRHPGQLPALYGNCQAGWAVALLAADCQGVAGPVVMNGSPLSYWGGEAGVNPMRLAAGLTGGVWLTRLLCDLSGGLFDGAWLGHNFEQLDPGHAWFGKYRALFAAPQAERDRFLAFERWWGEFCFLTRDEIVAIVENLFVGNRLEEGGFRICDSCHADFRRLKSPMLVFASKGDNITPPAQALGWIPAVWPTTDALVKGGQRICYLLHPDAGHLGIFVSADVARREHRSILDNLVALEALEPGLYEMCIDEPDDQARCEEPQYRVSFEPRRVEDLPRTTSADAFRAVRAQSEALDALYQQTLGPVARAVGNTPGLAALLKWSHPMRASRLAWARPFNAFAPLTDLAAAWARAYRAPVEKNDSWVAAEEGFIDVLSRSFDVGRDWRDAACEAAFAALYEGRGFSVPAQASGTRP